MKTRCDYAVPPDPSLSIVPLNNLISFPVCLPTRVFICTRLVRGTSIGQSTNNYFGSSVRTLEYSGSTPSYIFFSFPIDASKQVESCQYEIALVAKIGHLTATSGYVYGPSGLQSATQ